MVKGRISLANDQMKGSYQRLALTSYERKELIQTTAKSGILNVE